MPIGATRVQRYFDSHDPWLLHFTHIDNLVGIARQGLLADSSRPSEAVECGQPGIKERRRERRVPLAPGGVVADYVPFYFAPRSPMLAAIHYGRVGIYGDEQTDLVYLLTRLSHVIEHRLTWLATDRNAVLAPARFTADRAALATHIDGEIMAEEYWGNTAEDGSRRERRMAEMLVHQALPWSAVRMLAVCCESRVAQAEAAVAASGHQPKVIVRASWYFSSPRMCSCGQR